MSSIDEPIDESEENNQYIKLNSDDQKSVLNHLREMHIFQMTLRTKHLNLFFFIMAGIFGVAISKDFIQGDDFVLVYFLASFIGILVSIAFFLQELRDHQIVEDCKKEEEKLEYIFKIEFQSKDRKQIIVDKNRILAWRKRILSGRWFRTTHLYRLVYIVTGVASAIMFFDSW